MTTKRLIVTADDYGLCPPVNEAIDECLAAGTLRATCVMTNMPEAAAALTFRQRFPSASLGLHWTLSLGRPVLPPGQVASLVGPDGEFLPQPELRRRIMARRYNPAHVRAELTAQYERFRELAGEPDFWNTHQNVHVAPGMFELCSDLAWELGVRAMRAHRRITVPRRGNATTYNMRHPLYWLKARLIDRWTVRLERQGVLLPDGIVHLPGYQEGKAAIEAVVGRLPWRSLRRAAEWIIHPSTSADDKLLGRLTASRVREYAVFRDPQLRQRLAARGVEAVGFETLGVVARPEVTHGNDAHGHHV